LGEVGDMPKRKEGWGLSDVIIIVIILLLLAKGFGLLRFLFGVDPLGLEISEVFWGLTGAGIGFVYKELNDFRKEMRTELKEIHSLLAQHGERFAKIEAKLGIS